VVPDPPPSAPPFGTAVVIPVVVTRYPRAADKRPSRKLGFRITPFRKPSGTKIAWGIEGGMGLLPTISLGPSLIKLSDFFCSVSPIRFARPQRVAQ
jgi:hypothetical protein